MDEMTPPKTIGLTVAAAAVLAFSVLLEGANSGDISKPAGFLVYLSASGILGVASVTYVVTLRLPRSPMSDYEADLLSANSRAMAWTASVGWLTLQALGLVLAFNLCLRAGWAAVGLLTGILFMLVVLGALTLIFETPVKARHGLRLLRPYFPLRRD
ncbi:hypothetical protein [Caulobacter mirabilis]|uniref:Uncharacterized protein n=1 Tax=Caulobacter mirabilis TaxID=69666 RepID=A0A2D2AYB6_9CAUL|nr:hypothetical protein [Caulobacter mirabilis]ATQ42927.1 hypothetical protein CSW64_11165 [Caulobacter mirabilis]